MIRIHADPVRREVHTHAGKDYRPTGAWDATAMKDNWRFIATGRGKNEKQARAELLKELKALAVELAEVIKQQEGS